MRAEKIGAIGKVSARHRIARPAQPGGAHAGDRRATHPIAARDA
jgi:hypothetical protein